MASDAASDGAEIVGYLDDAIDGVDVLGTLADVAAVCEEYDVDVVYFAIPSASGEVLRDFISRVPRPRVELAVIPRTYRIVSRERVSVSDLTDVDILDLVGRAPVKHDMVHAREAITGRRVLVTGAAGSIGSRLVAQLQSLDPEIVVCVDRSESAMFRLGHAVSGDPHVVLEIGDIQSPSRMAQLMGHYTPDIVFHVAAYKHVPLMQENVVEAFNNNAGGTLNVMTQAVEHGVERVVYVSTDKAVHPTNVMGATKRIGELIVRELGSRGGATQFSGVRFGNVLESEGSVMQTFRQQLASKRNLTITHPDITRYFMTIDEAAQLVIQTATTGRNGDLFVLDMGEAIRVLDLAQGLLNAVEPSLGVDVIGLRPGEKMFEELSYAASSVDSTSHPKIFVVTENDDEGSTSRSTIGWVEDLLKRTSTHAISDRDLHEELRAFGFTALQ